jgi:hypothetical protein
VEGYEPAVIRGARRILSEFRPVVFLEINVWTLMAVANINRRTFLHEIHAAFGPIVAYLATGVRKSRGAKIGLVPRTDARRSRVNNLHRFDG